MKDLNLLNDKQYEAVTTTEGPLLVLAGAGSGKTRVLTHRIAYLIEDKGVSPWNILAITFTNKAAAEMRERVQNLVDFGDSIWVATFHSTCVRILRRHIDLLGYGTDFTIYDTDDQKTLIKQVVKELNLDPKVFKERGLLSYISSCKNEMLTPYDMVKMAEGKYMDSRQAMVYEAYQKRLKKNNAVDFDDLLTLTVQLFKSQPQVLSYYQNRFQYILVDEYQDTNQVQFELVYLLSKEHKNICVVGDDDQSIYRFRGADIRNILEFETHFSGTHVVKLEQNYRSTTSILDCANAVIGNNRGRKEKRLWSDLGKGEPVRFFMYENGYDEAEKIIRKIRTERENGASYNDYAILYRTNAQSRAFEEKCVGFSVPYRLVGGVNFYQRAEIKDILAYLKTIGTGRDDIAVQRILNVPKRGIGQTTVGKLLNYAHMNDLSLLEAIKRCDTIPEVGRAVPKLQVFAHLIGELKEKSEELPLDELIREILKKTEYYTSLQDLEQEKQDQKKENIEEFINKAHDFLAGWEEEREPELSDFLEEVALVADIDSLDNEADKILLMTIHGAKGLEFNNVFLCGMEEGLFPSYMSMFSGDPEDVEEERRLCYVGITRARKRLELSAAKVRTVNGEMQFNKVSRFIEEIPEEWIGRNQKPERKSGGSAAPIFTEAKKYTAPVKSDFGKTFKVEKLNGLDYQEGDRVVHIKFGEGTVMEIQNGKRDFEVRVNFDSVGEKKMFASFAKLKKV